MVSNVPSLTHANRHATSGPDVITPSAIGAASIAQLAGYVPAPAGPADGQVVAWSSALSQWVVINPAGVSELAYAENNTQTYQTVTGDAIDVTACAISVPVSSRPVWLSAGAGCAVTVTGVGTVNMGIVETTGTPTTVAATAFMLHGETLTTNTKFFRPVMYIRIGPTVSVRTFKLDIAIDVDSGTPSVTVYNGYSAAPYNKSWISAEAR